MRLTLRGFVFLTGITLLIVGFSIAFSVKLSHTQDDFDRKKQTGGYLALAGFILWFWSSGWDIIRNFAAGPNDRSFDRMADTPLLKE
jgi:hypothetical protein